MSVDFDTPYVLAPDLTLAQRDRSTVQIGTDPPRHLLITDAPIGTVELLAGLDGTRPLGAAISDSGGDTLSWRRLAVDLVTAEVLIPAQHSVLDPRLTGTRLALVHRHGAVRAGTIMTAREDAVVLVEGDGPIPDRIAELLLESGVGTVHQRTEVTVPGVSATRWRSRAVVQQSEQVVRISRTAPQTPATIVIHAGRAALSAGRMIQLMLDLIPHLVVSATPARTVIGPLVLPGRSACLTCLGRHRSAAETVGTPRSHPPSATGVVLAAARGAEQALEFIDGVGEPAAIDTTIEYLAGALAPRYRNWPIHPDCGCHRFLP